MVRAGVAQQSAGGVVWVDTLEMRSAADWDADELIRFFWIFFLSRKIVTLGLAAAYGVLRTYAENTSTSNYGIYLPLVSKGNTSPSQRRGTLALTLVGA